MRIPKEIKVGRTRYSVAVLPQLRQRHGCTNYEWEEIEINKRMTPKQQTHTFWHEVMHAILYDMGSKMYRNEKFVDAVGKRLAGVVESARF